MCGARGQPPENAKDVTTEVLREKKDCYLSRTWRHVYDEVLQLAPVGSQQKLAYYLKNKTIQNKTRNKKKNDRGR